MIMPGNEILSITYSPGTFRFADYMRPSPQKHTQKKLFIFHNAPLRQIITHYELWIKHWIKAFRPPITQPRT